MRRVFVTMAWLLMWTALLGQPAETEEETVARCLRDLRSPDVEQRRRAVLLIEKYRTPEVAEALADCLTDTDARVRHSALVSLRNDESLFPSGKHILLFRLLKDDDVHIRRQASAMLGLTFGILRDSQIMVSGRVRIQGRSRLSDSEMIEAQALMNHALGDEDAAVRRNVLSAARFFPMALDGKRLEAFFTDESPEVRLMALVSYERWDGNAHEKVAALKALVTDPSPEVRNELVLACRQLDMEGLPIVTQLMKDPVDMVRIHALVQLFNWKPDDTWPLLEKELLDSTRPPEVRQLAMTAMQSKPDRLLPVLERLLSDPDKTLRSHALRTFSRLTNRPASFYLKLLEDHEDMAEEVCTVLRQHVRELSPENFQFLMRQPSIPCKLFAIQYIHMAGPEANTLLMDACMEDSTVVRVAALRTLRRLQVEGWEEILVASLEDADVEIQMAAAESLCVGALSKEAKQALEAYLPTCANEELAARISRRLETAKSLPQRPARPAPQKNPQPIQPQRLPQRKTQMQRLQPRMVEPQMAEPPPKEP